jgi:hypothetical protein
VKASLKTTSSRKSGFFVAQKWLLSFFINNLREIKKNFAFSQNFAFFAETGFFGLAIVDAPEELAGWCKTNHNARF